MLLNFYIKIHYNFLSNWTHPSYQSIKYINGNSLNTNNGYLDINEYNYNLRFHMVKQGKSLVNFARSKKGDIFFRYVLTNFSTKKSDIDIFIKNLLAFNHIDFSSKN